MKKALIIGLAILLAISALFIIKNTNVRPESGKLSNFQNSLGKIGLFPKCPKDLSGILTYPLMDPKYIAALTPLGNINPPGHTSPVDHVYFQTNYNGKIPMGAPADSIISQIITVSKERTPGKYEVEGYNLKFVLCDGLELDLVNYNDIIDSIKAELAKQGENDCKRGIVKDGHGGIAEGQCYYKVNIPVTSGQQVGWTWQVPHPEESGLTLPFEIWAANYNVPPPSQTDWKYYSDDRYAHIMCPFDLYSGDLKEQFLSKFGRWEYVTNKVDGKGTVDYNASGHFIARNGEPLCGQVDQDIVGTIQGMWFSKPTPIDDDNVKFNGGLAFLHNNIDVTLGEVSVGGDLANGRAGVIFFKPTHNSIVDREPSEVRADNLVYCYNAEGQWDGAKKFLVKLIDDRHLQAEIQPGSCGQKENLLNPFSYER